MAIPTAHELRARVLYRDPNLLVLDKPAGLPVHAGPRGGPDLEAMLGALAFGNRHPPRLAHRLDTDTSGCLVLGRHPKALSRLGRLFSAGRVEKTYWAVVVGGPAQDEGRIDIALAKRTGPGGWRMVADRAGKPAVTDYVVLGSAGGLSWLELRPRTGRTHQIRVHCAERGFPILGDPFYGPPGGPPGDRVPLHLHSRTVVLPPLAASRATVAVSAEPPPHMAERLARLGHGRDAGGNRPP